MPEGWFVWGTGWVVWFGGAWGEYLRGSKIFVEFTGRWSAAWLSMHVSLLQVLFVHFAEVNYLPGFCVNWYSGGKGLIVTLRQILKCDKTRESIHVRVWIHVYMRACVSVCIWFTCVFAHICGNFNCLSLLFAKDMNFWKQEFDVKPLEDEQFYV